MSTTLNPEIAALWTGVEQQDEDIVEIRAGLERLNKIVRAGIRQAVWQSIALFVSVCITIAGGLAYQTSVLNNRFEQIEKSYKESDESFAASKELADEHLKSFLSEKTGP